MNSGLISSPFFAADRMFKSDVSLSWTVSHPCGFVPSSGHVRQIESIIGVSGDRKSQPSGPPFQWETGLNAACQVSHWNDGPEGWDFPVFNEHQCSILFLAHHHLFLHGSVRGKWAKQKN